MSNCIRLQGASPELSNQSWESNRLLRIGRCRSGEIVLEDSSISRRHAEIAVDGGGWVLRDAGSTNGTFLNGARVDRSERCLRLHDLVQCGNVVFVVRELIAEPLSVENSVLAPQVCATTEQSWEEAVQLLALDVTHRQRPGEQLMSLLSVGQHVCHVKSLDESLGLVLRDTVVGLKAQRGAIVLKDEATDSLTVHALFTTRNGPGSERSFSTTLARRCLETGQSLLCRDTYANPDLLRARSVQNGSMNSVICALLRSPRRRLGILHLDRSVSTEPFTNEDLKLADAIAANMSTSIESAKNLQEKQRSLFVNTVVALAQAIELRDGYTGGHAQRVTDYSLLIAEQLPVSADDRHAIEVGAPLHDIGKIGIDDAVLRKQGPLTDAEFERMKQHTVKGAAMVAKIPELQFILPIVRSHHERWDGAGYPDGLAGNDIPKLARLVAVADSFDSMTSDRPYRVGMPADQALAEIERLSGKQYDPACAAAFLKVRSRVEQRLHQYRASVDPFTMDKLDDVRKFLALAGRTA